MDLFIQGKQNKLMKMEIMYFCSMEKGHQFGQVAKNILVNGKMDNLKDMVHLHILMKMRLVRIWIYKINQTLIKLIKKKSQQILHKVTISVLKYKIYTKVNLNKE